VGFRFAAVRLASKFDVNGFVKNLSDGSVELVAEGDKWRLEALVEGLREEMCACIHDLEVKWQEATGEFSQFQIRFH